MDDDASRTKPDPNAGSKPGEYSTSGPPQLTLPKGGGAIASIGEKFSANPVTGTGTITVPIVISPGRSGFGPQLNLSYDSGRGNGPFGLGWSLSLPSITRRTDKGLPRYCDEEESDIFVISGAEDLVPVFQRNPDGSSARDQNGNSLYDEQVRNGYVVKRYRPRIEGLFSIIERWTRQIDGDTYWRSISKDNVTTYYGKPLAGQADSRIADSADPNRVFSWLICQSQDDRGNVILYEYVSEDSANVDLSQANEQNRTAAVRAVNRYLKRIKYGNTPSLLLTGDVTALSWLFEVVFDYDEGHYESKPPDAEGRLCGSASIDPLRSWSVRKDPFSRERACFEVRTYRLCRQVLMFHHFQSELGVADYLVKATSFAYQESGIASLITRVTQSGFVLQGDGSYFQRSLPPLDVEYTVARVQLAVKDMDPQFLANLPSAVDGEHYRWLDLDGEGLQCVLAERNGAWYYKRNLTPLSLGIDCSSSGVSVQFEDLTEVSHIPALVCGRIPRHQFMSLEGDGHLDCVVLERPTPGYYKRNEFEDWDPFVSLPSVPNVDWNDRNLRFVDVDGDGLSDVLITEQDAITYFPSRAAQGFGAPTRIPKPVNEEAGPAVVFADRSESIFLADMTGDGLSDIVRIRNGEVCYWPNLGYARFGPKVTMDLAPWFDAPDQFDPLRIRLADVDGSGPTDILYLAADGVQLYFNQAGNAWSSPARVMDFPQVHHLASIQALDLLGNGTACLVWTSSAPGDTGWSMRYLDLMGGTKPYLLMRSCNNLGSETQISYAPSTMFYLEDRAAGRPWATRLPFPVQVVERVETYDWVSRNRFVTRYSYHHGYFDGLEREFRGFGMVEQRDTEELGSLSQNGAFPNSTNIDVASYVPPVLTKTWFHLGVYPLGSYVSRTLAGEYWREPGLSDAQRQALQLPDTSLPDNLSAEEVHEALRSLKGSLLRQEVYALDGTAAEERPYSIIERNYTVVRIQPLLTNRYAVFLTHARESIDYRYERTLYSIGGQSVADPRITHGMVLAVDSYGNELQSAAIAYGRRYPDPDPLLGDSDRAIQAGMRATYRHCGYTNAIQQADAYRTPQPADFRSFELLNVAGQTPLPSSAVPGLFRLELIAAQIALVSNGLLDLPYEQSDAPATLSDSPYRRLIEHVRVLYRKDDLSSALPVGMVESMALPDCSLKLALTPDILALYRRGSENLLPDPADVLGNECGYASGDAQKTKGLFPSTDPPGELWISSGRLFYSMDTSDTPVKELAQAKQHFFLPCRFVDPMGNGAIVTHDNYDLFASQIADPLLNLVTATNDYRVLQPTLVTDANGNRSAVAFDALGLVAGTAVMGKASETIGDSLSGFVSDLTQEEIDRFFADPTAPGLNALLGNATSRVIYDKSRLHISTATAPRGNPIPVATICRVTHVSDLAPGQSTELQLSVAFFDGLGREIQRKTLAEPGPLISGGSVTNPRWITSGWIVYNNKGKVARQYEPFFDDNANFNFGVTRGISPIFFYDAAERLVVTLHPAHSWEKVTIDPWRQENWDVNDTILIDDPTKDPTAGSYFQRLAHDDYSPTWYEQRKDGQLGPEEQDAAAKTALHAATPTRNWVDPLGRAYLSVADNGSAGKFTTRMQIDVEGNRLSVTDALGRVITRCSYGMLGVKIYQTSPDAGDRWILKNAIGKQTRGWDTRNHTSRHVYDALARPTDLFVRTGDGPEQLAEQIVYGEGQVDDISMNLRHHIFRHFDCAGIATHQHFDFKGNLLKSGRQFLEDFMSDVDWSKSPSLESEMYTSQAAYDALNRPTALITPDSTVISPGYNAASAVNKVEATLRGTKSPITIVDQIAYDAMGQREEIQFGNGIVTAYQYDPITFRLVQNVSTRISDRAAVQSLRYSYDPIGNITQIEDAAQETIYFRNQVVAPNNDYTYDALYRLVSAQGREHIGQVATQPPAYDWNDLPRVNLPHPNDGTTMQRYVEGYQYDPVGNFLSLTHQSPSGGWNRRYSYTADDNRLMATSMPGDPTAGPYSAKYSYDANGNMTGMPHLTTLEWDFKDQLHASQRQVVGNNAPGEKTYYIYDSAGHRVRKVTVTARGSKKNERLTVAGFDVYREYDNQGAISLERQSIQVMDNSQRIALIERRTQGDDGSPLQLIRYQFSDHLRSVSLELDDHGQCISYEEYYPYGGTSYQAVNQSLKAAAKRYRFTGRERDEETGLNYHGARYYSPWLGRWTSCDPLGIAGGLNVYLYAAAAPTTFVDQNGMKPSSPDPRDTDKHQYWPSTDNDPMPPEAPAASRPSFLQELYKFGSVLWQGLEEAFKETVNWLQGAWKSLLWGISHPLQVLKIVGRALTWIGLQIKHVFDNLSGKHEHPEAKGKDEKNEEVPESEEEEKKEADRNEEELEKKKKEKANKALPLLDPNRVNKFPTSKVEWTKWTVLAFLAGAALLIFKTIKFAWSATPIGKALQILVPAIFLLLTAVFGIRDFSASKSEDQKKADEKNLDAKPLDRWSWVHHLAGWALGLLGVSFPVVALLTVAWEFFEMYSSTFGNTEINANRVCDILVAWIGFGAGFAFRVVR
jgi:RHS repeat-associated protein